MTEEEIADVAARYDDRRNVTRRLSAKARVLRFDTGALFTAAHNTVVGPDSGEITSESATGGDSCLVTHNGRRIECGLAELPHLISAAERG